MTSKQRLMATLRGEPVDRAPVCFYELNGLDQREDSADRYHVYTHPSWRPLLELTREKTDIIVMRGPRFKRGGPSVLDELTTRREHIDSGGTRHAVTEIRAGDRVLASRTRRPLDVDTTWTTEHLLKDEDDLKAWLELPVDGIGTADFSHFAEAEARLGDTGIVMIDIPDALCHIAPLFSMEDYTVLALTQPALFHRALEKAQEALLQKVEAVAKGWPGRLWRVVGPEYAVPPYLPPRLYGEYVLRYDKPLIDVIHKYGGYARLHQHGRCRDVLDMTVQTGCMAIDPIEPPPQGDVSLEYVKQRYGEQLVLFGNLELSDIELLDENAFAGKVLTALEQGTAGNGRGFVLMPSASPIGRVLPDRTLRNYQKMIEVHERFFQ